MYIEHIYNRSPDAYTWIAPYCGVAHCVGVPHGKLPRQCIAGGSRIVVPVLREPENMAGKYDRAIYGLLCDAGSNTFI